MERSPTKLALAVEALTAGGRAAVAESADELALANLAAADARSIADAVVELGWAVVVEDATPEVIQPAQISDAFAPYRVVIAKPPCPAGVALAVSRSGVARWLADSDRAEILWVASVDQGFDVRAGRLAPWGVNEPYEAEPTNCDPRKVVRDLSRVGRVPEAVDQWILRDPDQALLWEHWAIRHWARLGATALVRALSDEVEDDGRLVFRGPPIVRLAVEPNIDEVLGSEGFRDLQRVAAWVFEAPTEMRPRHALFGPEIARTATDDEGAGQVLRRVAAAALEGAGIARAFGLADQSRDSLKAMTDLRKSISEEISKLSDTTRQIAGAVAAALFGGIGLIAARLVVEDPSLLVRQAAAVVGAVLLLYVAAVVASGWHYVRLQRSLRSEWHSKIYRFIPAADYEKMVTKPAASAELGFSIAAWIGGIAATALFVLVLVVAFSDVSELVAATPAQSTGKGVSPRQTGASAVAADARNGGITGAAVEQPSSAGTPRTSSDANVVRAGTPTVSDRHPAADEVKPNKQ